MALGVNETSARDRRPFPAARLTIRGPRCRLPDRAGFRVSGREALCATRAGETMTPIDPPGDREAKEGPESRTERRERRRRAARRRMAKHGASLRRVYRDVVEKRKRELEEPREGQRE